MSSLHSAWGAVGGVRNVRRSVGWRPVGVSKVVAYVFLRLLGEEVEGGAWWREGKEKSVRPGACQLWLSEGGI